MGIDAVGSNKPIDLTGKIQAADTSGDGRLDLEEIQKAGLNCVFQGKAGMTLAEARTQTKEYYNQSLTVFQQAQQKQNFNNKNMNQGSYA